MMEAWPHLCSLLFLCHFCIGGKPSCILGGHRCLGKESTHWVLLMRALQQRPMPLATGWTLNRRDTEQSQGSRLCTKGQGFTGAWPDSPHPPNYSWISSTMLSLFCHLVLDCAHFISPESAFPGQWYLFCLTLIFLMKKSSPGTIH